MSTSFDRDYYIDYIKLQVTGGLLELEIDDSIIGKFVDASLVELQRYINEPKLLTIPFAKVIDLKDFNYSSILHVYRTEGFTGDSTSNMGDTSVVDPMYAQQWMAFSNGGLTYSLNNYVMNYLSYNTLLQMRNTSSTDLSFKEDKQAEKLYINCNYDIPRSITLEYIPVYTKTEDITSDYWIDILKRLSLAMTKVALGRIRTRFTQSNALWTQDGETMLQEGNEELKELREILRTNSDLFQVID